MTDKDAQFDKYKKQGSTHLQELMSRDIRKYNAYHMARYKWIMKLMPKVRGANIIDVGCGDGLLTYFLAREGALVTGLDNEETGLGFAKDNLKELDRDGKYSYEFKLGSAYAMPIEPESFDTAVSCEVIEHLDRPEEMLRETAKVLKPGGTLVLTTPYKLTEIPQDSNHIKEYYPEELKELVSKYFDDVEVVLTHHLLWRSIYTYGFRFAGNRQFGRWIMNLFAMYLKLDPFMFEYKDKHKFDLFATIAIKAKKK